MSSELQSRVARALSWDKEYRPDSREVNILRHYDNVMVVHGMSLGRAAELAESNILGQNGHPSKPQRNGK